jgi:hydroxyacylglutathione hydrolase
MAASIHSIKLGLDQCYVVKDQGVILIDAGAHNKEKQFKKGLAKIGVQPEEIQMVLMTHGHFDHIGGAREIKAITGAKIAIHVSEKEWLEKGLKPMPPGVSAWGRFMCQAITIFLPLVKIPAAEVDIVLGNEDLSLAQYGIAGKAIHTPGHSPGSISVLLESGEAFVGDMAMNALPLRWGPGLPIFAEDMTTLKNSWQKLLDRGAKTIYPAHGNPFSVGVIRRAL